MTRWKYLLRVTQHQVEELRFEPRDPDSRACTLNLQWHWTTILNKWVNVCKDGEGVGLRLRSQAVLGFERLPCHLLARSGVQVSVPATFGSASPFPQFLFEIPLWICFFSTKDTSTNMYEMPLIAWYATGSWGEMQEWTGHSPCPLRAQISQVWTRKQLLTRHMGLMLQDMGAEEGLINAQDSIPPQKKKKKTPSLEHSRLLELHLGSFGAEWHCWVIYFRIQSWRRILRPF